jgi:hypothetical protein
MTGSNLAQTWIDVSALVDRNRQRVRKRQPEGGLIGVGTSPCSTMRSRVRVGSGISIAESSACVYGCSGCTQIFRTGYLHDPPEIHYRHPRRDVLNTASPCDMKR